MKGDEIARVVKSMLPILSDLPPEVQITIAQHFYMAVITKHLPASDEVLDTARERITKPKLEHWRRWLYRE